MGRPIKKKFFGNLNNPDHGSVVLGSGVGGESVATINVSNSGTLYSQGTTLSISAPNITGGTQATISYSINSAGNITVDVVNPGAGYTSAPTLTVTTASLVTQYVTNSGITATNTLSVASVVGIQVGMRIYGAANGGRVVSVDPVTNYVTSSDPNAGSWTNANNLAFYDQGSGFAKTVTLTSTTQDAIQIVSYLPTASQSRTGGDIIKQESSRRYLVQNSDGVGICRLATGVLTAGQMHIIATDWTGASYYVTKLTAHKATVVNRYNTSTAIYTTGQVAPWTIGDTTGTYITLSNTI